MDIKLGLRGSEDAVNHIIIKIDGLMLVTADNLFLAGSEVRKQTGQNVVALLETLSKDHEISLSENISKRIEDELSLEEGALGKYIA